MSKGFRVGSRNRKNGEANRPNVAASGIAATVFNNNLLDVPSAIVLTCLYLIGLVAPVFGAAVSSGSVARFVSWKFRTYCTSFQMYS